MTTNSENSIKLSYDGGYIQKIKRKVQTTPRTPIQIVYKPFNFHKSYEASLAAAGFGNSRYRERSDEFYADDHLNRLIRLLNISHWNHNDDSWLYTPPPTRDFSSLFNRDFKQPVFELPKFDVSTPSHKHMPASTICLIISCILCVLTVLCAQRAPSEERSIRRRLAEERASSNTSPPNPQENNSDNGSLRLLVNSEYSPQSDSHSDLPPPYFECASNNDEVINKNTDVTSEELPPPYSTYLETLNNTDEIPKVDKGQSVEELQSRNDTEVHLNNIADTDRSNIAQNSSDDVTLSRVVETTIDINDIHDGVASNQTKIN